MKPIGFAFDNFNFIVYPLKLSGMDGVIAAVDDPVTVPVQHFNNKYLDPYTRKTVIIIFMRQNPKITLTDHGFERIRKIDLKGLREGL